MWQRCRGSRRRQSTRTNLISKAHRDGKVLQPIRAGLGELQANQSCQEAGLSQSRREKSVRSKGATGLRAAFTVK